MTSLKAQFEQAVADKDIAALQAIFSENTDINELGQQTVQSVSQILAYAALANHVPSIRACLEKEAKITLEVEQNAHVGCALKAYQLLIPAGLDVNRDFGYGGTALTEAVMSQDMDFIRYLLSVGANPNIGTLNGSTALEVAIKECLPSAAIKLIAEHDAEFPTKGLLCLATIHGADAETLEYLLRNGADPNETTDDSFATKLRGKKLSALHLAVRHGHVDLVKVLLRHGADAGATDVDGKTPRDTAGETSHAGIVDLF